MMVGNEFDFMDLYDLMTLEETHYIDSFGTDQKIDALLVVVPTEHQGALETIMLDSISEDPYDASE
jgi:hypothetical protein